MCPLHRFLGCVYLRRFVATHVRSEEALTLLPSPDQGTILFRVEGLKCKIVSYPNDQHQSLHLKLEPEPAFAHHWRPEMIQLLERYFDTRVAVPPFKANAVAAFCKILQCPIEPLKDIVNLLQYEMMPELVMNQNLKWNVKLCVTVPPSARPLMPPGQPGLLRVRDKMLMFFHLSRANISHLLPPGVEPLSVVVPIVYDIQQNQTNVAQKEMNQVISVAQQTLSQLAQSGSLQMDR